MKAERYFPYCRKKPDEISVRVLIATHYKGRGTPCCFAEVAPLLVLQPMSAPYEISPPDLSSPVVATASQNEAATAPALVPSDGELLKQFADGDSISQPPALTADEAFGQIVDRHCSMVWRVCRQILIRRADAEDAFQVTFLLLARQARTIRSSESAAGWLYRVAFRTAMAAKRRRHRDQTEPLEAEPLAPAEAAFPDLATREIAGTLMQELEHLPAKYRTPLVMRYLEGHSRRSIADQTDTTIATVQGQLARGKQLLRSRLLRRGISLSTAMALIAASQEAGASTAAGQVAPRLISQTTSNATAITAGNSIAASTAVVALYHSGVRAMLAPIVKPLAATLVALLAVSLLLGSSLAPAEEQAENPSDLATPLTLQAEAPSVVETDQKSATLALQPTPSPSTAEQNSGSPAGDTPADKPKVTATWVQNPWQYDAQGRATDNDGNLLSQAELEAILKKYWTAQLKNQPETNGSEPSLHELSLRYQHCQLQMSQMNMRYQDLRPKLERSAHRSGKELDELQRTFGEVSAQRMLAKADLIAAERALRERLAQPSDKGANDKKVSQRSESLDKNELEPYVIRPGDQIRVQANGTSPDRPLNDVITVERSGTLPLGPTYGRVKVVGLTNEQAETAVRVKLSEVLKDPEVQLSEANPRLAANSSQANGAAERPTPFNGTTTENWPSGGLKQEADYVDGKIVAMVEYSEAGELLYEMADKTPPNADRSASVSANDPQPSKPASTLAPEIEKPEPPKDDLLAEIDKLLTRAEQEVAKLERLDKVAAGFTDAQWTRIAKASAAGDELSENTGLAPDRFLAPSLRDSAQNHMANLQFVRNKMQDLVGKWAGNQMNANDLSNGKLTAAASKTVDTTLAITQRWKQVENKWNRYANRFNESLLPVDINDRTVQRWGDQPVLYTAARYLAKTTTTVPAQGETEVDPDLSEIKVTFDRDMNTGGMSWTGGGEHFPKLDPTRKPRWIGKRTCVLPVKLEAGKFYRVGINSKSANNFKGRDGAPADHRVIAFTTKGAPPQVKRLAEAPKILRTIPGHHQGMVDLSTREIEVHFDRPMSAGMSWNRSDQGVFPMSKGGGAVWSKDRKTCLLTVDLKPNTEYALQLNGPRSINFQSAAGVPLEPTLWKFTTGKE